MLLNEFFDYKNEIMKTFCKNRRIVELVTDSKDVPIPAYDLRYHQIFPYEFVPDTVSEATTFICFDVDIMEVTSKTFLIPVIYVWAFTHASKLRTPDGLIRLDELAVEIGKELNGSRYLGLGELDLRSVTRFVPINDYQGRAMTFVTRDFNRPRPSKQPPANRKNYE